MKFSKMHGIGNDFVMVNGIQSPISPGLLADLSREICDRKFGIGSDGLILAERGEQAPFKMRMFNPDGSESEMCGNGIRCFMKYLHSEGETDASKVDVETGAGILSLVMREDGKIQVDMGKAWLNRGEIGVTGNASDTFIDQEFSVENQVFRGTSVGMGNPHVVVFTHDVSAIDLVHFGPKIENHPLFPNRINVHFVQIKNPGHIIQRTWERGAGITLACGTGACACAVASFLNGLAGRQVKVTLPGGDLDIYYREEDEHVLMTGPAETVFVGDWLR